MTSLMACAAPGAALAQHVVTDEEAGKLTLEALTAAPVYHASYHAPIYRSYLRSAMATRSLRHGAAIRYREASYRTEAARPALVRKASWRVAVRRTPSRHHRG